MEILHSLIKNPFPLSDASSLWQMMARDDGFISLLSQLPVIF